MAIDERKPVYELQKELDTLREDYLAGMPPEHAATLQRTATELVLSGIVEHAATSGDRAQDFTLPNAVGRQVRLSEVTARSTAVVTFYRGAW